VRTMECTIIAHEKTAQIFRSRPNLFKVQPDETGSDWEHLPGLGNIRWTPPEITFTQQMAIYWGESPVLVEYHPGPNAGASWVIVPDARLVFVGDAVVPNQPPFLANADIQAWLESLKELLSPAFRGFTIVSGRGGVVSVDDVRGQVKFLKKVDARLERLANKKQSSEVSESLISNLLEDFQFPETLKGQYSNRLRYGLTHYLARHYHDLNTILMEEN